MSAGGVLAVAALCREQTPHIQDVALGVAELQLDFKRGVSGLLAVGTDGLVAVLRTQTEAVAKATLALGTVNMSFQMVEHTTAGITQATSLREALAALSENEVDLDQILREVDDARMKLQAAQQPTETALGLTGIHGQYGGQRLIEGLRTATVRVQQVHDDLKRILMENRLIIHAVEDIDRDPT